MALSSGAIDTHVQSFFADGFCILREHFDPALITRWHQAAMPIIEAYAAAHPPNRGPRRWYVTLPFTPPFDDPRVFNDDGVVAILEKVIGPRFTMPQLASDTPFSGSEFQDLHHDTPPLFAGVPGWETEVPPYQIAVNIPLVDMTMENGPFEVARGTHMLSDAEGRRRIASGEIKLEPLLMKRGDAMIRDVRHLHRGTPNRTDTPRPMAVIGYSRAWFYREDVHIEVPRATWERLPERAREMLRMNSVVDPRP